MWKGKSCWAMNSGYSSVRVYLLQRQAMEMKSAHCWLFTRIILNWCQSSIVEKQFTQVNPWLLVRHVRFHSPSFRCCSPCTLKYILGFMLKHVLTRKMVSHKHFLSRIRISQVKIFTTIRVCTFMLRQISKVGFIYFRGAHIKHFKLIAAEGT